MNFNKSYIKEIYLDSYRNFKNIEYEFSKGSNLIIGNNGTGKTNILESISLLAAGKGIRRSNFDDFIPLNSNFWHNKYKIHSYMGDMFVEQKFDSESNKRLIFLNEQKISQNDLINLSNIFWITPQQNILFLDTSQERRKFFDRIVYNFDFAHASKIAKYEHYQKERMKIILQDNYDSKWVEIIEKKLSELVADVTFHRHKILSELQFFIDKEETIFPHINLKLDSEIDRFYVSISIYNSDYHLVKEKLQEYSLSTFANNREKDARLHKTNFGSHKTDFFAILSDKNIEAKFCSTGEQQSILITIILSLIKLFTDKYQKKPIILLDEIFTHLDEDRRIILSEFLVNMDLQSFVTSTEDDFCQFYAKNSNIIKTS